jgi:hypothetical protein
VHQKIEIEGFSMIRNSMRKDITRILKDLLRAEGKCDVIAPPYCPQLSRTRAARDTPSSGVAFRFYGKVIF